MSKFVTEKVHSINAEEDVEQLIIDDIKQLDAFENLLEKKYRGEFRSVLRFIEHLANGNTLPDTKFKHLKGGTNNVSEYEFKTKHLRIYAIQQPNRKIIICGGYKNSQPHDITRFRSITNQFLESLKSQK